MFDGTLGAGIEIKETEQESTSKSFGRLGEGITHYLEIVLVIVALGYILEFFVLSFIRLSYPYELEWIEGAKIDEILRILEGYPLYGPPKINFIPLSYTPFYFYLSAGFMRILGVGFFAPRLVSILSTIGTFFLIYAIVKKGTHRQLLGIIGAGIFAACYQFTGAWMDLVKVDSLFLFLLLAGFYLGLEPYRWWKLITSGTLLAAAFFTKQVAFPILMVLAPISMVISKGKTWLQWLTASMIGILTFSILEITSDGWFSFYTIRSILHHPFGSPWLDFWKYLIPEMWPSLLIAGIFIMIILADTLINREQLHIMSWQYLGLGIALIAGGWTNTLKIWSYKNTFLPACLGLAILSSFGLYLFDHTRYREGKSSNYHTILDLVIIILIFSQFYKFLYNPFPLIPTQKERQAAQAILERLRNLPGEVLVYNHGFMNRQVGKTAYLHPSALGDILIGKPSPGSDTFNRREMASVLLEQAFSEQRFDWVVMDSPNSSWPPYYIYIGEFVQDNGAKYPGREDSMVPKSLLTRNPIYRGGSLPLNESIFDNLFLKGWSKAETWGRWGLGNSSNLSVILEEGLDYSITITAHSFCAQNIPAIRSIEIHWNDDSLGTASFRSCKEQSFNFIVESKRVKKDANTLYFTYHPNNSFTIPNSETIDTDSPSVAFSLLKFTPR